MAQITFTYTVSNQKLQDMEAFLLAGTPIELDDNGDPLFSSTLLWAKELMRRRIIQLVKIGEQKSIKSNNPTTFDDGDLVS